MEKQVMATFKARQLRNDGIETEHTFEYGTDYFSGVRDFIQGQFEFHEVVTVCHQGDFQMMGAPKMKLVGAVIQDHDYGDAFDVFYVIDTEVN